VGQLPFDGGELAMATHPEFLAGLERILGTAELQLGRASIGATYAGVADGDQDLRVDGYGANSIVYPREDGPSGSSSCSST
jgi:hypothetical protein